MTQQPVRHFEDLIAWQHARALNRTVYELTRKGTPARDRAYTDQIRRASLSVMNNIAEGFERGSRKEFARFLHIARGSAGEVRSLLYVATDEQYASAEQLKELFRICEECSRTIWGLARSVERTVRS
jgi:four helix bundle protein